MGVGHKCYLQKDSKESEFDFGSSSSRDNVEENQQFELETDSNKGQKDEEFDREFEVWCCI